MKISIYTLFTSFIFAFNSGVQAQQLPYQFTKIVDNAYSDIKSQGNTGTCWSFSTSSFLESEIYRSTGTWIDISEMYFVRQNYIEKAINYVQRQGKAQFSEGALAHDPINAWAKYGVVAQDNYMGNSIDGKYNHSQLFNQLDTIVRLAVSDSNFRKTWKEKFKQKLDFHLGSINEEEDNTLNNSQILVKPTDYITIGSWGFQPNYSSFILPIPDNFSNGLMYNLPLDEFLATLDHALTHGYTACIDIDVSEKGFRADLGVAIIPDANISDSLYFKEIVHEQWWSNTTRDEKYFNWETQDDHLMHIVGLYKDQLGNKYYKTKNSWGKIGNENDGMVMISQSYLRAKAISYTLHRDAIPMDIAKKMF